MTEQRVFRLSCAVQCYAWGKQGTSSEVASLSSSGNPKFKLDDVQPYAELWMGTHHKGPCIALESGESLSSWIGRHPNCLGTRVQEVFPTMDNGQLPFLFKVLSVGKSLSIQAHPNKSHAEQLHCDFPDKYPDSNHKPEMAIALTSFKAMCGFRPREEIYNFLTTVPELAEVVGPSLTEALGEATNEQQSQVAVQSCFTALMTCDPELVKEKLTSLVKRLTITAVGGEAALVVKLNAAFPGDVGCFCIYFLNVLDLEPGQAIFLEANLPHAYLSGDCIECMACSDNVVRAGLTPKFKDVEVLCSMLNYRCLPASQNLFQGVADTLDPAITIFDPPVLDFAVKRYQIPTDVVSTTLEAIDGASVLLVIEGDAQSTNEHAIILCRGAVLFIAANESVPLNLTSSGMLMFRAYCSP